MLNGSRPYVTVTPPPPTDKGVLFFSSFSLSFPERRVYLKAMSWVGGDEREGGGLSGQCSHSPSASHSTAACLENQEGIYSGMVTPLLWFPKGSTISQSKSKKEKIGKNIWWKEKGFGTKQEKKVSAPSSPTTGHKFC